MTTTTTLTPAQQWNAEQAARLVPDMIAAVASVKRSSAWIARVVLGVTTPHQVLFLGSLGHGGNLFIAAWVFAALIPLATDLGMLTMLRITQTDAIDGRAKRRALVVLVGLVAESAAVNALAPGHPIFRVLVGLAAVLLAAVEWVHASVKPDPAKLAAREAEAQSSDVTAQQLAAQQAEDARIAAQAKAAADAAAAQLAADVKAAADKAEADRIERNRRNRERRAAKREQQLAEAQAAAQRKADKAEAARIARQVKSLEQLDGLEAAFAAADAPVSGAGRPAADFRKYL